MSNPHKYDQRGDVDANDLRLLSNRGRIDNIKALEDRLRSHVFSFLEQWQLARLMGARRRRLKLPMPLCYKYIGDNDATCPQLTCIRDRGHVGGCDNTRGDHE